MSKEILTKQDKIEYLRRKSKTEEQILSILSGLPSTAKDLMEDLGWIEQLLEKKLEEQRKSIIKELELEREEAEKWKDEIHCTCLAAVIDNLKSKHK